MLGFTAVAVLVGALTILNLVLTFGVIRRLREHTDLISKGAGSEAGMPALPVDQRVAEFEGVTTDGEPIARDLLTGQTLVGFLSPGCAPCQKRLPDIAETARLWPGGRGETAIVVVGKADEAGDYLRTLTPVARVVVEAPGGPIAAAFKVSGYPIFGVVDSSGRVLRSEMDPAALRLQPAGR